MISGTDIFELIEFSLHDDRKEELGKWLEENKAIQKKLQNLCEKTSIESEKDLEKLIGEKVVRILDIETILTSEELEVITDSLREMVALNEVVVLTEKDFSPEARNQEAFGELTKRRYDNYHSDFNGFPDGASQRGYSKDIQQAFEVDILTKEEEQMLFYQIKVHDSMVARQHLIEANIRFAFKECEKYIHKVGGYDEMPDLLQTACIGMNMAIDRFDPRLDLKFITYARWWIMQQLQRSLNLESGSYHVPIHILDKKTKLDNIFREKMGNNYWIATNQDKQKFCDEHIPSEYGITTSMLTQFMSIGNDGISLDSKVGKKSGGDRGDVTFANFIPDAFAHTQIGRSEELGRIRRIIATLLSEERTRDQEIIKQRLGLNASGKGKTLEEVGENFDMTRERVRQLVDQFIRKMRLRLTERMVVQNFDDKWDAIEDIVLDFDKDSISEIDWQANDDRDFLDHSESESLDRTFIIKKVCAFIDGRKNPGAVKKKAGRPKSKASSTKKTTRKRAKTTTTKPKLTYIPETPFQPSKTREELIQESPLYPIQMEVQGNILSDIDTGCRTGSIQGPPRMGKTVVFIDLLKHFFHYLRSTPDKRAIIVVSSRSLIGQTVARVIQFFPEISVGVVYASEKNYDQDLTVMTYNMLLKLIDEGGISPEDYEAIIFDEAHRTLSDNRLQKLPGFIQEGNAYALFFSATMEFNPDKSVKLLSSHQYYRMSVLQGIEYGLVTPFHSVYIPTKTDISDVKITNRGDYHAGQLEKKINNENRNQLARNFYLEYFSGEQVLVYCAGIAHANALEKLFQDAGISAFAVHSNHPSDYNDDRINQFGNGEIDVLINARMLIEGYDNHRIRAVFCLDPCKSRVDVGQSRPRGMTPDSDYPEKICVIAEWIDEDGARPSLLFEELAVIDHAEATKDDNYSISQLRDTVGEVINGTGKRKDFSDANEKIGVNVISEDDDVIHFYEQRIATAKTKLRFKGIILGSPPRGWQQLDEAIKKSGIPKPFFKTDETMRICFKKGWKHSKNICKYQKGLRSKPIEYISDQLGREIVRNYASFLLKQNGHIFWEVENNVISSTNSAEDFANRIFPESSDVCYITEEVSETPPPSENDYISFADIASFAQVGIDKVLFVSQHFSSSSGNIVVHDDQGYLKQSLLAEMMDRLESKISAEGDSDSYIGLGKICEFTEIEQRIAIRAIRLFLKDRSPISLEIFNQHYSVPEGLLNDLIEYMYEVKDSEFLEAS